MLPVRALLRPTTSLLHRSFHRNLSSSTIRFTNMSKPVSLTLPSGKTVEVNTGLFM